MTDNRVRGPTSALSSFLRERGIVAPTNRFRSLQPAQTEQLAQTEQQQTEQTEEEPGPSAVLNQPSRQPSKKKKPKKESDDELPKKKQRRTKKQEHPDWKIKLCQRCQRRFLNDNDQRLCAACVQLGDADKVSKGTKRQAKMKEQEAFMITGETSVRVYSLKDMCIRLIAQYLDDVEELGDISPDTKCKISKIISKRRLLTQKNVNLFLGPMETDLELYDCTLLNPEGLSMIAHLCPNLKNLRLEMCGRMTDKVLQVYSNLDSLEILDLKGPFLCSAEGWSGLFSSLSNLKSLTLHFSAKLNDESIQDLVKHCPELEHLELHLTTRVSDDGIKALCDLQCLKSLVLSDIGSVQMETILALLDKIGSRLERLGLIKFDFDDTVVQKIGQTCTRLGALSLDQCHHLTTEPVAQMLSDLKHPLYELTLNRNNNLENPVLEKAIEHHKQLQILGLNGLDLLGFDSLSRLKELEQLQVLDLSWVRSLSDEILQSLLHGDMRQVSVFGCQLLTPDLLNGRYKNTDEKWIRISGNEFD
ncbi:hypothetical protein EDD86DRAFT_226770 [Gorgonomyces haynaldii]|nr:hypothetical protein EDD86DRAFT_226770 [Gorgonomyces haynaldii]